MMGGKTKRALILAVATLSFVAHAHEGRDLCATFLSLKSENAQLNENWLEGAVIPNFDKDRAVALISSPYSWESGGLSVLERTAHRFAVHLPETLRLESDSGGKNPELNLLAFGSPENLKQFLRSAHAQQLLNAGRTSILTTVAAETLPPLRYGRQFLTLEESTFYSGLTRVLNSEGYDPVFGVNVRDSGYFAVRLPFEAAEIYIDYLAKRMNALPKHSDPRGTANMTFEDFKVALAGVLKGETRLILSERNKPLAVLISLSEWDQWWNLSQKPKTTLPFPYRTVTPRLVRALSKAQSAGRAWDENAAPVQPTLPEGEVEPVYQPPTRPVRIVPAKQVRKPRKANVRAAFVPLKGSSTRAPDVKTRLVRPPPEKIIVKGPRTMAKSKFRERGGAAELANGEPGVRLSEEDPYTIINQGYKLDPLHREPRLIAFVLFEPTARSQAPETTLAKIEKLVGSKLPEYWEAELQSYRNGGGKFNSIPLANLKITKVDPVLARKTLTVVTDEQGQSVYVILPW